MDRWSDRLLTVSKETTAVLCPNSTALLELRRLLGGDRAASVESGSNRIGCLGAGDPARGTVTLAAKLDCACCDDQGRSDGCDASKQQPRDPIRPSHW